VIINIIRLKHFNMVKEFCCSTYGRFLTITTKHYNLSKNDMHAGKMNGIYIRVANLSRLKITTKYIFLMLLKTMTTR